MELNLFGGGVIGGLCTYRLHCISIDALNPETSDVIRASFFLD